MNQYLQHFHILDSVAKQVRETFWDDQERHRQSPPHLSQFQSRPPLPPLVLLLVNRVSSGAIDEPGLPARCCNYPPSSRDTTRT